MSRKFLYLFVLATVLCMAFPWVFHYFTDSARMVRVARSHGIEMVGAVVTLEPLDSFYSDLGRTGHETYRVTLTQKGFQSVLSQIQQLDCRPTIVDLQSFGFTTDWSGASHRWASDSGNNLFVIAIADESMPVIELCSAW